MEVGYLINMSNLPYRCHYSSSVITKLFNRSQLTSSTNGTWNKREYDENNNFKGIVGEYFPFARKPSGLWYGFQDNWINRFNNSEELVGYLYDINIIDKSKILSLNTDNDILIFYKKYQLKYEDLSDMFKFMPSQFLEMFLNKSINWIKVANDYDGIEITYKNFKFPTKEYNQWCFDWDICSGCIWNVSNISIKNIK